MNVQKLENHKKTLQDRHRKLDKEAEMQYTNFYKDEDIKLIKLKKLELKREIELIQTQIETLTTH